MTDHRQDPSPGSVPAGSTVSFSADPDAAPTVARPARAEAAAAGRQAGTADGASGGRSTGMADGAASPGSAGDVSSGPSPRPRPSRAARGKRLIRSLISGDVLRQPGVRRSLPYAFFVAFLMLLYIANTYRIQRLQRTLGRLQGEVKELRTKSLSINEVRMTATRQSEVMRQLRERGIELEESVVPPKLVE